MKSPSATGPKHCNFYRMLTVRFIRVGTFGQRALWDLEKAIKGQRRLPPDIQRIASAETLRNLQSSPGPKWRYFVDR